MRVFIAGILIEENLANTMYTARLYCISIAVQLAPALIGSPLYL